VPRYDSSQTFNAVLPASWVAPGLTVQISYTPGGAASALSIDDQPSIGPGTSLKLVLVPIRIGSLTASVPSAPLPVRESLVRSFPYAYADISVTTRAVYTPSGLTSIATQNDIGSVLSQLETIRAVEAPKSMYYGFINDAALQATIGTGRIAGVGWVNDPDNPSNTWRLSAVGTDSRAIPGFQDSLGLSWAQWQRTLIHELGHVHSRHHAPCGDPSNPDPNFPYSNGKIGAQPIYSSFYQNDSAFGAVGSTTIFGSTSTMADIMSYCPGAWFSDYNYYYVQRFAEKYSGASTIPAASLAAISATKEQSAFLVLSGEIGPGGVKFRPALLSPSIIGDANSAFSGYQIIVRTLDGKEFTQNLSPLFNSEDRDTAHFSVSLPVASRVASVEVQKAGATLPSDTPTEAAASLDNLPKASWQQDAQGLSIRWNSSVEPYLSVFRVTKDGRRSVLALFAGGGELQVPAADIAGAGIEIQLSTNLNARSMQIIAP
jgi:hypothetical protein